MPFICHTRSHALKRSQCTGSSPRTNSQLALTPLRAGTLLFQITCHPYRTMTAMRPSHKHIDGRRTEERRRGGACQKVWAKHS